MNDKVEGRQKAILEIASRLGSNPLFQLSTANQELFHSNMLFWLATNAREQSAPLWAVMFGDRQTRFPVKSMRERMHVDLMVCFNDGSWLGIENKIHSIATKEQLERYQLQLDVANGSAVDNQFRLLSLFRPLFELPGTWEHTSYVQLIAPLASVESELSKSRRETDAHIVRSYRDLVRGLIELCDVIDPLANRTLPVEFGPAVDTRLRDLRLLPLVRKAQASRIIEGILEQLPDLQSDPRHEIRAGMTNATGLMEHLVRFDRGENKDRRIGWQIQSGQFRLVAIRGEKRDGIKAVDGDSSPLGEAVNGFIDPSVLQIRGETLESRSRKPWCKYGDGFVYRYGNLPRDVTTDELISLCMEMSARAAAWTSSDNP